MTSAELIVGRVRTLLERRLRWLAELGDDSGERDDPDAERAWQAHAADPGPDPRSDPATATAGSAWQRLVELFGLDEGDA